METYPPLMGLLGNTIAYHVFPATGMSALTQQTMCPTIMALEQGLKVKLMQLPCLMTMMMMRPSFRGLSSIMILSKQPIFRSNWMFTLTAGYLPHLSAPINST
eukprot:7784621-Ditylum_brightwellii.AAC.1